MVQNGKSFLVEGQCQSKKKVHKVACYVETQKMLEMCSERVPWKNAFTVVCSLSPHPSKGYWFNKQTRIF